MRILKKTSVTLIIVFFTTLFFACKGEKQGYTVLKTKKTLNDSLREMYKKPPSEWIKPTIDNGVVWTEIGLLPKARYPKGQKPPKEIIALGKKLFFDPRLSQTNQIACISCHHPNQSFTDNRQKSLGFMLREGTRNAPTLLNLSYNKHFFWDGRASSYEEQALSPLQNENEMNTHLDTVVAHVSKIKGYRKEFKQVLNKDSITIYDITYALGMFQRSLVSRKSRFDKFLEGKIELSEKELKGLHLFRTKARCINCHNGKLFTDGKFHNLGLTYYGGKNEDLGRYNVTKKAVDVGKFKTPSLRDVIKTRPWMHNGLFNSIEGILLIYSNGMPQPKQKKGMKNDTLFPKTSPLIKPLNLTRQDKEELIAFLHAISSPPIIIRKPILY